MSNALQDSMNTLAGSLADLKLRIGRLERLGTTQAGAAPAGTVTSVGLSMPDGFAVSNSPIIAAGTLGVAFSDRAQNAVLAGPASGGAGAPSWRALTLADLPAGIGGVTSVGLSAPSQFAVGGSPVTGAGTLALSWADQSPNLVLAGPASGAAGAPAFRALVDADIPAAVVRSITLGAVAPFSMIDLGSGAGTTGGPTGNIFLTIERQNANLVYAGPITPGQQASPTFRGLVAADVTPALAGATISAGTLSLTGSMTVGGSLIMPALAQPGALTAAAMATAGNPNGTYYYKVTFVTASGETGYWATVSAAVTVASKQIALSAIPTGPAGVTARRIYRATSTAGPFKLVTTLNDNTTTVYTDNVADGSLGAWQQWRNSTGGQFYGGAAGTTWMGGLTTESLHVNGLSVGVNTLPNTNGITLPNGAWIQAMAVAGNGVHNIISCNSAGQLQFGSGFLMGNQSITQLSAISHWGDAVVSSGGDGANHDYIINRSAGGIGSLKWFGGAATAIMTVMSSASGGAMGIGTNLTPTSKLHVDGPIAYKSVVKTASFTVDGAAGVYILRTGGSAATATLPLAASCPDREIVIVKDENASGTFTVLPASGDTVGGAASWDLSAPRAYIRLHSDGANTWMQIGTNM